MLRPTTKHSIAIYLVSLICLSASCQFLKVPPDTSELSPVFARHHLKRTDPHLADHYEEVAKVEEADSALYNPAASEMLCLVSTAPTGSGEQFRPTYWLRVEDYVTAESAKRRAEEYVTIGANERIAKALGIRDSLMASTTSVRQWAVARGRRVYALTTDASAVAQGGLPQELKESVSALPET